MPVKGPGCYKEVYLSGDTSLNRTPVSLQAIRKTIDVDYAAVLWPLSTLPLTDAKKKNIVRKTTGGAAEIVGQKYKDFRRNLGSTSSESCRSSYSTSGWNRTNFSKAISIWTYTKG